MYVGEIWSFTTNSWGPIGGPDTRNERITRVIANIDRRRKLRGNARSPYRIVRDGSVVRFWPPYLYSRSWSGRSLDATPALQKKYPELAASIKAATGVRYQLPGGTAKRIRAAKQAIAVQEASKFVAAIAPLVPKKLTSKEVREISRNLPQPVAKAAVEVATDASMSEAMAYVMERESEFSSPMAAMLAGIALDPRARRFMDESMDTVWKENSIQKIGKGRSGRVPTEVVIGAGLHAAIYCAVRVAKGLPKPLVLEAGPRVGGSFAASLGPSFYLNSRNRPGSLSVPGSSGALNVLPGAPIQPSDLGGEEYQTNDALAWVIRTTLAACAEVVVNMRVAEASYQSGGNYRVRDFQGVTLANPKRVVIATGLSLKKPINGFSNPDPAGRLVRFEDFMARMDQPFPLRGLKRVAVVGGGDAGKTVIEALTGQGPKPRLSVASLDYPEEIDWYGCKAQNCADWVATNRNRYKGIGKLLPGGSTFRRSRVTPMPKVQSGVGVGYECAYVDERPYDLVVICIGYNIAPSFPGPSGTFDVGARTIARFDGRQSFVIGPAAQIPLAPAEQYLAPIAENGTAAFRYASRTAQLAGMLDAV